MPRPASTIDRVDAAIIVASASVALVSGLLLAFDMHLFVRLPAQAPAGAPLARLTSLQHDVRHRPRDLPVWGDARPDEDLHADDFLFTDKGSGAVLAFTDQTTIELGENTLIAIERVADHQVLNVLRGSLRAKPAPGAAPVFLKVAGQATPVRAEAGADVELRIDQGGHTDVTVLAGQAQVGPGGALVEASQRARLGTDDGAPQIAPMAVQLRTPADGMTVEPAAGAGIALAWDSAVAGTFTVEIAAGSDFLPTVEAKTTEVPAETTGPLAPGTYYWRVRVGDQVSAVRRFTVASRNGPRLFRPLDGQGLELLAGDGLPVDLQWEPPVVAAAGESGRLPPLSLIYDIEVAQDAAFATVAARQHSEAPGLRTTPLPAGRYYWRVRASGGPWSTPAMFTVQDLPPPVAPVLLSPPASASLAVGVPMTLTWVGEPTARAYTVEITSAVSGVAPVTQVVRDATMTWTPPATGTYAWHVRAKDAYGRGSTLGESRNLKVVEAAAAAAAVAPAPPATAPATVATTTMATAPLPTVTSMPSAGPLPAPATSTGGQLPDAQASQSPQESPTLPGPPTRLAPVDGTVLSLAMPIPVVSFYWQAVHGAATYTIEVARDEGFDEVVFAKRNRGQDANVELPAGTYYWHLRSHRTAAEPGAWSSPWRFSVEQVTPAARMPAAIITSAPGPGPERGTATDDSPSTADHHPRDGRIAFALAPTSFHYKALNTGAARPTTIDATLFDSFSAALAWRAAPWLIPELAYQRTATILFRSRASSDPPGQLPLHLQPETLTAAARFRLGGDQAAGTTWLDAVTGAQGRHAARFHQEAAGRLTVAHADMGGPALGLGGGWRPTSVLALRLDGTLAQAWGRAAVQSSRTRALSLGATYDFAALPLGLDLGLAATHVDEVLRADGASDGTGGRLDERMLTVGLGLDL